MKVIAAADRNWAIGKNNKLLVSIPADMRQFRQQTMGKVVLMGRKTLESFPNGLPLSGRTNIVLSSKEDYKVKGAVVVHSIEEMLKAAAGYEPEDVYCIGGDSLYRQLLPWCDEAIITRIDFEYEADAWFPDLDAAPEWRLEEEGEEQTYFDIEYRFCRYVRIKA